MHARRRLSIGNTRGAQAGIDSPAIRTLIGLVHDIEDGRRELSWDTFKILLDQCAK